MKDGFIKVASATPEIKVADCDYNCSQIIKLIKDAGEKNIKLLVFPELCITGYTCLDLFFHRILLDGALNALKKITASSDKLNMLIFVGVPLIKDGALYNCAAAVYNGKILGVIPKTALPNYNEFYEKRQFTPFDGNNGYITIFDSEVPFGTNIIFQNKNMSDFKVCAEICEDLWIPQSPSIRHAENGAVIIANLSASNELIGKAEYRKNLVSMQSGKLICGYIYTDAGCGESTTDLIFAGHNLIVENGAVLNESKLFSSGLLYSEIDIKYLCDERRRMSFKTRNDAYQSILFDMPLSDTELSRKFYCKPFVPEDGLYERANLIADMQAYALKKRMEHTASQKLIIGVSGGLDSTLALLICVRAANLLNLSLKNIYAITMPCFGTTKRTKDNATLLCEKLGVTLKTIDISSAVKLHLKDIGHDESIRDTAYENAQARERTQVLMDVANEENGIVVGTGDLSETALGWSTYNGDHMSMYGVNCSVPKTLVRHIISYFAINSDAETSRILNDILETPVSPELLPPENGKISQKTEEIIGSYELHDFFLYYMIRKGFSPSKVYRIAQTSFDLPKEQIKTTLVLFIKRFFSQQFKRSCMPDGVKIGTVSLSPRGDLKMPSDASYLLWLKELDKENI